MVKNCKKLLTQSLAIVGAIIFQNFGKTLCLDTPNIPFIQLLVNTNKTFGRNEVNKRIVWQCL